MKAVGFTFNDFDFVINPLQFTGMDGIFTMVQDAIESDYSTSGQAHTNEPMLYWPKSWIYKTRCV
jgi:hypothetical protein